MSTRRSRENRFAFLGHVPPVLRCASSSHPCRAAARPIIVTIIFLPSRAGGHATGTPQRTSAAHAPPQNDSPVRACDSVGEIAHKPHAYLFGKTPLSLAPGTSSIAACLGFSVLDGDVTRSHHRPTGRGLLKRKPLCRAHNPAISVRLLRRHVK